MAVRIYDQTIGQLAGLLVPTTGLGAITRDGLEAYAQMVVSASGVGLTGDTAGEGNVVSITGATIASGSITLNANTESVVIDTQGFENVALTVSGFGTATIQVQWSNLPSSGFTAGLVTPIDGTTTSTNITASGQYTAASGGRYMRIITIAYTSGTLVVTPTFYAGGGGGGSGGGGSTNLTGINGVAPSVNSGTLDNGTLRTTLATDSALPDFQNTQTVNLGTIGAAATQTTLASIETILNTPATELPPPVPVASGNTTLTRARGTITTATQTAVVTATASQTTRVHVFKLSCDGANVVTIQTASTTLDIIRFPSTGGALVLDFNTYWWYKTATNEALNINTTTTANVDFFVDYVKGA